MVFPLPSLFFTHITSALPTINHNFARLPKPQLESMEQFLAFIFYFIVGLYVLRLGFIYLLPWLIRRWMKRVAKQMENQQHYRNTSQSDPQPQAGRNKLDDLGEYVDFEEINDEKK